MSAQPTFTMLLDWVEGRLDAPRSREVAQRVAEGDARVVETVEWIRRFLEVAEVMPLEQPAPELSERLRQVFPGYLAPGRAGSWTDAELLYDTRSPEAATGTRGPAVSDAVHLAFDSELGRFVLEIARTVAGEVDLRGMLVAGGDGAVELALLRDGRLQRATRLSAGGQFELLGVPDGVDELWLSRGERRVRAALDLRRA